MIHSERDILYYARFIIVGGSMKIVNGNRDIGANIKNLIFLLGIVIIVLSFLFVYAEKKFDYSVNNCDNEIAVHMIDKVVYKQDLELSEKGLKGIAVRFGVYGKENEGNLFLDLYESEQKIQSWQLEVSKLNDNEYQNFYLDKSIDIKPDAEYYFTLKEEYIGDNGIAVWAGTNDNRLKMYIDDENIEDFGIDFKTLYTKYALKRDVLAYDAILLIIVVLLCTLHVNNVVKMVIVFISLGVLYFIHCPLGMVPDEPNHFFRAFEISCGNLISNHIGENGVGGNILPEALKYYTDNSSVIDWKNTVKITFGNTSLYSPLTYFPQVIGIKLARYFTDNVSMIFYAGRLSGFLICIALSTLALYVVPFGKNIIYAVMLCPLTFQEMISLSPDGFTISLALLFLAYILNLCYKKRNIERYDLVALSIIGIFLALCKIVYVVLLLLILMLPNKKYKNERKIVFYKIAFILIGIIINLIWLKISSGYLVEFQPGVNTSEQAKYVLTHILQFYFVVIRTSIVYGEFWIKSMSGALMGDLNIQVNSIVWITYVGIFVVSIFNCSKKKIEIRKYDKIILLGTFLAGCALICTSLYVQWTAYQNKIIEGIQGRYFIPIIGYLAMWIILNLKDRILNECDIIENKFNTVYSHLFLIMLNEMAVLDIIAYYIN